MHTGIFKEYYTHKGKGIYTCISRVYYKRLFFFGVLRNYDDGRCSASTLTDFSFQRKVGWSFEWPPVDVYVACCNLRIAPWTATETGWTLNGLRWIMAKTEAVRLGGLSSGLRWICTWPVAIFGLLRGLLLKPGGLRSGLFSAVEGFVILFL